ncbi:hypothetical protein PDIG_75800 [Penicillium digitatum PHI26]|uniref:Glycosyl hydrolase family 92 domain-containing protein n=2 Tax=Penicillium digitatum TaxID=36651 RepID=K9G1C1_PEND2|nr:hypothetical protein PDIP_46270 [Penicillium digitatum Pd1]EKV07066.1 hypothetical protein PDIG_75800 [Penicillium digitatum PHI26]EKV13943.1 hypothetical protein PDIP_46270 [Penicillium digitatum Pd1]
MGLLGGIVTALYASNAIATKDSLDDFDVLKYVDPLIGTANGGMAKAVADTTGENQAGFAYDTKVVTGFSHMHDSGTGGSPSMGNFPIFAQGNCPHDDIKQCKWQQSDRAAAWEQKSPEARPGYFSISLANGVHAEMTTTNRSALYRFTFSETSGESLSPVVLLDLMDLPQSRISGSADVDQSTGRITASGTFSPSFGIGSYKSWLSIWDSFRSIHPLLTLVDPFSQSLMMRSLIDTYRHEGYLPDCRMSLCKGFTQGGSNADVVMADAYLKKVPGIDWDTAYEAVVKDAEEEPQNWDVEGRGGLRSWKNLGYIPFDDYDPDGEGTHTRSISRTVEYAYNDFCIAEMAQGMGHQSDFEKYRKRSENWAHMFKPDQKSSIKGVDTNFTGFLQPRYTNGTWGYQDPIFCSPLLNFTSCYLNPDGHETYEGSAWMYTFYAPHDMGALIKTLGGANSFTSRLSYLHDSGLLYVGDEQAFLPVYQFHYSGRPGLSAKQSHFYIPSQFNTTVNGIAGNDDSGAMGSFVVLSMMGLWPVPGQDVYLITPPYFNEVSIRNALTGKVATIRNINFDPSYKSIYIQSAKWNDKPWTNNWITHDFFADGGILELVLGPKESVWGTHVQDLPPSLSDYH